MLINPGWCCILVFSGEKHKRAPVWTIAGQRVRQSLPRRADKVIE